VNINKINHRIAELNESLNQPLVKELTKSPCGSISELKSSKTGEIIQSFNSLNQHIEKSRDIRLIVSSLKDWEKRLLSKQNEISHRRIFALVRLALNVGVAAAGILGFVFLAPSLGTPIAIVAGLTYFGMGIWNQYHVGLLYPDCYGAGIIAMFGPLVALGEIVYTFFQKTGFENLQSQLDVYQLELNKLAKNLEKLQPELSETLEQLNEQIANLEEKTKQEQVLFAKKLDQEMDDLNKAKERIDPQAGFNISNFLSLNKQATQHQNFVDQHTQKIIKMNEYKTKLQAISNWLTTVLKVLENPKSN
jgi:hypothetical protein